MNKSAIEKFAIWARKKLVREITYKAGLLGVTEKGIAEPLPQSAKDMQLFDVGTKHYTEVTGAAIGQRAALVAEIKNRERSSDHKTAFGAVVEEVAYTWFNRLIAIRFMEVNGYLPSRIRVLSSENPAKNEPDFVTAPFETDLPFTAEEQDEVLRFKDENRLDELFQMLFIKQCNQLHEILPELFETTSDYTELLLTISFTDKDGVVYHLTHDIEEKDFDVKKEGQVEIIGWLYQYYNSELKDETFAQLKKNVKITKERIPAATQLFTPDWIVRYMVENSLGRLWVEGHPNDNLKAGWKYYLEEAEQEESVKAELEKVRSEYRKLSPEDIKVIDPCMGSGHILVYAFDVLMQIYESQGYTQRDAARSIIANNLYGLDIDRRAYQLAYFAVMMKARQYNRRILTEDVQLNLFVVEDSTALTAAAMDYIANGNKQLRSDLQSIKDDLTDAREYGSLVNISPVDFDAIDRRMEEIRDEPISMDRLYVQEHLPRLLRQAKTMAQKYHVVVTNPPYMAVSNASGKMQDYIKKNFPDSKADLFAVFIERCGQLVGKNGYQAMITQHAWMFLSSFEKLRAKLRVMDTVNMAHLGPRAFEEIGGEVVQTTSFVMRKSHIKDYKGTYCRLIEPTTQQGKENMFLSGENRHVAQQDNFSKIPGSPVAYWVSKDALSNFDLMKRIGDYGEGRIGLITGDAGRFIRFWFEVSINKIGFGIKDNEESIISKLRWFPIQNGGGFRRWYGNTDSIVNWENDGYEMKYNNYLGKRVRSHNYNGEFAFQEAVSWTTISSGKFCCRYAEHGFIFDTAGPFFIPKNSDDLFSILAFLESKVANMYLEIINPTINFPPGYIQALPFCDECMTKELSGLSQKNISLSRSDWDSFETSWDFKRHPLV